MAFRIFILCLDGRSKRPDGLIILFPGIQVQLEGMAGQQKRAKKQENIKGTVWDPIQNGEEVAKGSDGYKIGISPQCFAGPGFQKCLFSHKGCI